MHSFNALAGGDVYGVEFGTGYFYEQAWPQQAFDYRLEYIMNHVNSKLGKPWKQLNDYIFAFEAENEAMIGKVWYLNLAPDLFFCADSGAVGRAVHSSTSTVVSTSYIGAISNLTKYCLQAV